MLELPLGVYTRGFFNLQSFAMDIQPKKPAPIVLEQGMCMCKYAPMGHGGLEGYMEDMDYRYERLMSPGAPSEQWYRVYHHPTFKDIRGTDQEEPYYETCSIGIFQQHFKIFKVISTDSGTSA